MVTGVEDAVNPELVQVTSQWYVFRSILSRCSVSSTVGTINGSLLIIPLVSYSNAYCGKL